MAGTTVFGGNVKEGQELPGSEMAGAMEYIRLTAYYHSNTDHIALTWLMVYDHNTEDFEAFQVCRRDVFAVIGGERETEVLATIYRNSMYFYNVSNPASGAYFVRAIKFPRYPGEEPTVLAESDQYRYMKLFEKL